MVPGIDQAVIGPNQFFTAKTTDFTKKIISVKNGPAGICNADNRMLIEGKFLIPQLTAAQLTFCHQLGNACRQFCQLGIAGNITAATVQFFREQITQGGAQGSQRLLPAS